jgi:primosomal protein N' (replication factor Y)
VPPSAPDGPGVPPPAAAPTPPHRPPTVEPRVLEGLSGEPPVGEPLAAAVLVDVPLAHLDRPFDYAVPADLDAAAQPGVRVRVRFAGRLVDGTVVARQPPQDGARTLRPLERVVSPVPVVPPPVLALARAVAERWAGTVPDVLRLAVPPRHARAEAAELAAHDRRLAAAAVPPAPTPVAPTGTGWGAYRAGEGLLDGLRDGQRPHVVWTARPGEDWPARVAEAVAATVAGGRGALVVVPDHRDVARQDAALTARLGPGRHVALQAELGPQTRYRRFLRALLDDVPVVLGTRGAVYAPVRDLGLVVVWDDGDDLLAEPRAPGAHARDVALLRAHLDGAAVLLAGTTRSVEAQRLVRIGWAVPLEAARADVRAAAPTVRTVGDDRDLGRDPAAHTARLPTLAWRAARDALTRGPVLVQVPRRGYLPALACDACRAPARCRRCTGPLVRPAAALPVRCGWCATPDEPWSCPQCGRDRLRAVRVGAARTAEELGRAFPGVPVRSSGLGRVLHDVPDEPALVVATPGAEPRCPAGYAAALLLDGDVLLGLPHLRAGEEAVRRWLAAADLVRPAERGGVVVLLADPVQPAVQAIVRWDPVGFADRELAERTAAALPPAVRVLEVHGDAADTLALLETLRERGFADLVDAAARLTDPVDDPATRAAAAEPAMRCVLRVPYGRDVALAHAVRAVLGERAARKAPGRLHVRFDPVHLA